MLSGMPHTPPEFEPGDKQLRLNLYLLIAAYLLLGILLEPVIDFLLVPPGANPFEIVALADEKRRLASYVYTVWRLPPILFFLWFGWRVIASLRLPPAGIKFPFSVRVTKGKPARMFGMLLILIALLLLYRELLKLMSV